jgi:hypothetical protein
MGERTTHFSWRIDACDRSAGIPDHPLEVTLLLVRQDPPKRYLGPAGRPCVGAACAKPRLDDVIAATRINSGQIPGPR